MGIEFPAGYSLVSVRTATLGKANQQVVTFGVADTAVGTPDAVAHALYTHISGTTPAKPWAASEMHSATSLEGVTLTRGPSSAPTIGMWNEHLQGVGPGLGVTPQVAVLVRKNTALGGRKGRGRMFMPAGWVQESQVDHIGVLLGTHLSWLQTLFNNLHAILTSTSFVPHLFHSTPGEAPTPITGFSVQQLVATQRRRLR